MREEVHLCCLCLLLGPVCGLLHNASKKIVVLLSDLTWRWRLCRGEKTAYVERESFLIETLGAESESLLRKGKINQLAKLKNHETC